MIVAEETWRRVSEETLADYLVATEELDDVLTQLTREFCANDCTKGEYGCCKNETMCYDGFFGNRVTMAGQKEEARENGWKPHDLECCIYMIPGKGCALKTFKPAICIGSLCPDLEKALSRAFSDKDLVFDFISCMDGLAFEGNLRSQEVYFKEKVSVAQEAASLGRRIIDQVPTGFTPYEYISSFSQGNPFQSDD